MRGQTARRLLELSLIDNGVDSMWAAVDLDGECSLVWSRIERVAALNTEITTDESKLRTLDALLPGWREAAADRNHGIAIARLLLAARDGKGDAG